jgi:hypothetical protein
MLAAVLGISQVPACLWAPCTVQAFQSTVVNASGWSFIDEGGPGKRKWGYVSTKPDSVLAIKVC